MSNPKIYSVPELLATTFQVTGNLLYEFKKVGKKHYLFHLSDGLLETDPPQSGYDSFSFTIPIKQVNKFINHVKKSVAIEDSEEVYFTDNQVTLTFGWDSEGKIKVVM